MARATKKRILDTALELFNSLGIEGTPVTLICERLEISPGNLTYHFPKKHDIVLALEERFQVTVVGVQEQLLAALSSGERSDTPEETVLLLKEIISLVWENRFYIASYAALNASDSAITKRFASLERRARASLAVLVQHAQDVGNLKPLRHPNSIEKLSDNIWYLVWGRILFKLMTSVQAEPDVGSVVRDCLVAAVAMIEPHVSGDFAAKLSSEAASH